MRPPPTARPSTWLFLAMALSACGSRSTLLAGDGPPTGGSAQGGSPQGGSPQGGSPQGGAGGQGPCTSLAIHPPVLAAPAEGDLEFDSSLRLTASSDDGLRVTGVFVRKLKSSEAAVYHTTLSPWKTWPADANLPVRPTLIHPLDHPAPARSPGGHFTFATLTAAGVFLFPALDPDVSGQAPSPGDIPLPGADVTFVAPRATWQSGPTHLAGSFDSPAQIGTLLREDGTVTATASLGCASVQPSSAAAVPFQDGWLAAVSSGSPVAPG